MCDLHKKTMRSSKIIMDEMLTTLSFHADNDGKCPG